MKLGIDATKKAGGCGRGAVVLRRNVASRRNQVHPRYYLGEANGTEGIHVLGIKDMAGLLKQAAGL